MARGIFTYKSYMFRNKDPVIDELRTIIQDVYGGIERGTLKQIEYGGGPSASCMKAWFFGKTKRPSNSAVEAAGRTMGKKRIWTEFHAKRSKKNRSK